LNCDKKAKEVILRIAEKIKEDYVPQRIVLYGSYAYGTPHRDSYIDLLIVKDTSARPIDRRVEVRRIVSGLRKGFPFSAVVLTPEEVKHRLDIDDQFLNEILSRGEVLYAR
jgi:predicted nucleotidyltransferase